MKIIKNSILIVVLLLTAQLSAQHHRKVINIKDLHEKKWEYITKQVKISEAEATKIKPLFLEYENALWSLHKQSRELRLNAKTAELSDKEYRDLNNALINIEIKKSNELKKYHIKLSKILKPETLYQYHIANKQFKRELLKRRNHKSSKSTRKYLSL